MATCESCGRDEPTLEKVQRIYLLPEQDLGTEASPGEIEASVEPRAGDIEHWCASCCATFPHAQVSTE